MTKEGSRTSRKDVIMNMINCMQFVQNNVLKMHRVYAGLCSGRSPINMKILHTELRMYVESRIVKEDNYDIWMKHGCVVNHRKKLKKNMLDAVKKVRLCDDDRNVGMKSRNVLPIRGMVGKMID